VQLAKAAGEIFFGEAFSQVVNTLGFGGESAVELGEESIQAIVDRVEQAVAKLLDRLWQDFIDLQANQFFVNMGTYAPTDNNIDRAESKFIQAGEVAAAVSASAIPLAGTHFIGGRDPLETPFRTMVATLRFRIIPVELSGDDENEWPFDITNFLRNLQADYVILYSVEYKIISPNLT